LFVALFWLLALLDPLLDFFVDILELFEEEELELEENVLDEDELLVTLLELELLDDEEDDPEEPWPDRLAFLIISFTEGRGPGAGPK
jgi:hypothetical protein